MTGMESEVRLLQHLVDGRFHSGESLAREMAVSRAAIWKQIRACEQRLGLKIDAVPGRGYRLAAPVEFLDAEIILESLADRVRSAIPAVHIHHSIDSTNSWLMRQAAQGARSGTVCLAERQDAGKGRHGRQWISPFGRNIYLSLLWRSNLAPIELAGMSLAAAVAVVRVLLALGCHEVGLKWPNDVLWRNRKLAGLLLEVAGETGGPTHLVIGVGLNTYLGVDGEAVDQPWIDLHSIPGLETCSRNSLASQLIGSLMEALAEYQQQGLPGFMDEWHRYDRYHGSEVEIRSASQSFIGRHLGIDASGGIRLQLDGAVRTFYAGEVSLRSRVG